MEDGLERGMHLLYDIPQLNYNNISNEHKILYVCLPNDIIKLDECIITIDKRKAQELYKKNYKISVFITPDNNGIYTYSSN
jgi:hypothetical protein